MLTHKPAGMADRLVRLERRGAVAILSLNRPARHNALVPELLSDLLADIDELRYRLGAEREAFVTQVQTQQALDGIDQFLRRQNRV